jgi:glycogen(starch) synthase
MSRLAQALGEAGHSVNLLTEVTDSPMPHLPAVTVTQVPVPPAPLLCSDYPPRSAQFYVMHAAAVYREVRRIHEHDQPVDAVLAPLWSYDGVVCALDSRFPTVTTCITSLRTMTELDGTMHRLPDMVEQLLLERQSLLRSRYLHGLTDSVLAKTISDFGLNPEATAVVGRGLPDRREVVPSPATRSDGEVRVLFVGRLEHRKGVDVLLAAARELGADSSSPITFTLAGPMGDPAVRGDVEQAVSALADLTSTVQWTGEVSDDELARLFVDCDIVCAPSRYESHGVVLIEAMMFGKPIVTCDGGGISEVVQADHNALVVAPDDSAALAAALKRLAGDPELRSALGNAARAAYEQRFDVRVVAQQTETFLGQMIETHRGVADTTSASVPEQLELLLSDTFGLSAERTPAIVGELLEPRAADWCSWADARQSGRTNVEIARLREAVAAQEETLAFLHERDETLRRIEQGGWWRLRSRLLPLLRLARRLRVFGRN